MLHAAQARLEARFAELAARRGPHGYPVYAIEHGLAESELQALRQAASDHLKTTGLDGAQWLVWIALAAEAGYRYDGEEFWPSLDLERGEWSGSSERSRLRGWYRKFAQTFGGPTPVGRWAEHFSIIAWPIANAVLPRYLQNHFARHLYELRYELAQAANGPLVELGELLRDRLPEHGSRFADFLQQTDLTARIVLALRDEDLEEDVARLEPATLQRFVTDLEQRREARTLLREARRVIREGRWRLDQRLRPAGAPLVRDGGQAGFRAPRLNLGGAVVDGALTIGVVMPELEAALAAAGLATAELAKLRIALDPAGQRWSPALALLGLSGQVRPLLRFPDPGDLAFPLDGAVGPAHELLADALRVDERPVWLLRRHRDGLFRELRGGTVAPGEAYILLCRAQVPADVCGPLRAQQLTKGAPGVFAYRFGPLGQVSASQTKALAAVGLGYRLRARIAPAGLSPRPGEVPTWILGEPVALHVTADFDVAEYQFELEAGSRLRAPGRPGGLLLEIDSPGTGRRRLTVNAVPTGSLPHPTEPAILEFEVRPARAWADTVAETAGVQAFVHPPGARLEDLLSGAAQIVVHTAANRRLSWAAAFVDGRGLIAGPFALGERLDIARILHRLRDAHSDAIDDAHRVDLIVTAEDLGRQVLRFPHAVDPLRWRLDRGAGRVWLVDESGHDLPLHVFRYDLTSPTTVVALDHAAAAAGVKPPTPGSLFCARYGDQLYASFFSVPGKSLASFGDLAPRQVLETAGPPAERLSALLRSLGVWRAARPVGPMALVRKQMTVSAIEDAAATLLCGAEWLALLRRARVLAELEPAQQAVCHRPSGFGYLMRTGSWPAEMDAGGVSRFIELASRYRISHDAKLCSAALRAAWSLAELPTDGPTAEGVFAQLLEAQDLVRGAFLARAAAALSTSATAGAA